MGPLDLIRWARTQQAVTGLGPKAVLMALATYADAKGRCWPSQATLAAELGVSERTIWVHLGALQRGGLISRQHRAGSGGHRTSDVIVLHPTAESAGRSGEPNRKLRHAQPQITTCPTAESAGELARELAREGARPVASDAATDTGDRSAAVSQRNITDRIVAAYWDQADPKPMSSKTYVGKVITNALAAGHAPTAIEAALGQCNTITDRSLEYALKNTRRPNRRLLQADDTEDQVM